MNIRTFENICKGFILSEFSGGTLEIATGAFGANQQFGIDQQDGALEISQNGKLLWSSTNGPHLRPKSISSERPFTPQVNEILRRADAAAAARQIPFVDSTLLLLGLVDGEGWADSYAADIIAEEGNVTSIRDRASSIANATGWKRTGAPKESAAPESEDPGESFQKRMQHMWGVKILGRTTVCSKCGAAWTEENMDYTCDVAVGERAGVQLTGCLFAAEGNADKINNTEKGDYGWSPAFQAVKDLRAERDKLAEAGKHWRSIIEKQCGHNKVQAREIAVLMAANAELRIEGDRLRMSLEHCRHATLENFDPDSLPATADEGVELHAFVAIRELRNRYDDARKALEAERSANADKVQTIYRQSRERRTIREAVERDDMAGLRKILNPPESDESGSVKKTETEIKTVVLDAGPNHLKIVEIENVTALRAERDDLREALATCERAAVDDSSTLQGTADAAIFSVMDLCADRDRIRSAIASLREKVIAHLPCVCGQGGAVCHRHEIEETLDDFYRRAGVGEAKGPERAPDVMSPAAEKKAPEPCDPERIKDKLVIRFDSLPGPEPAGFVETELNGKGVNAGEWVQDNEFWLLVIDDYDPKTIADLRRENSRLKARARDFRDELAARAMQALVAKGPGPDESHGNQKRILAFHAYLYADAMLKQR